jgi:hypothetical protein
MKLRSLSLILAVVVTAGCGPKKVAVSPVLEETAQLYPFEPIPIPAYEGMGFAKHSDLRVAQEMARSQAMADLGANIFDTASLRVNEVLNSRSEQGSLLTVTRNLSTSVPLVGKKFFEYRVGQKTGTVYCRAYMAKSEVDENIMTRLVALSHDLIDKPIREKLTRELSGKGTVNSDIEALTQFHEQQFLKLRPPSGSNRLQ